MTASCLMVQGTASSAGKSLIVAALCRILRQDGVRVAPFKAQNMSNNSFVTPEGAEIGRAQAAQAEAAMLQPEAAMNPILLKPESDYRSQLVLNGTASGCVEARQFFTLKPTLWPHVTAALDNLRDRFEVVVIEGAGSPAEINLRSGDIVNMRVARYADAPVLLVGDIDRGGVFAHLVGTLCLLEPEERRLVRALIINKFRGDNALLAPGLTMLTERTGLPIAGVVPHLGETGLAEEDAVSLDERQPQRRGVLDIAVIRLPHIANFDDFQPIEAESDVTLRYVTSTDQLGTPDLLVLPGSKSTIADLEWLRSRGLDGAITRARAAGSAILGICGGYQILGRQILDRQHVESSASSVEGLGLLDVVTEFEPQKVTHQVRARILGDAGLFAGQAGLEISAYEIHMGRTPAGSSGAIRIERRSHQTCFDMDGAVSSDGWVLGTYLHGLFANEGLRRGLLETLSKRRNIDLAGAKRRLEPTDIYDRLAANVRAALDMDLIYRLLGRRLAATAE